MATLKDIARIAQVSTSTVSEVLNGKGRVSPHTRLAILTAARNVNYRPNELARALRFRKTRTIGLIIPSVSNPFYPALARGAEDAAFAAGYDLLLCNSDRDPDKEQAYITSLLNKWVDGVILAAPIKLNAELLRPREAGAVLVLMNESTPDPGVDEIWIDYRRAARSAVDHLLQLGHRRIAFIGGPLTIRRFADRLDGYRDALIRAGLPHDRFVRAGGYDHDTGYRLAAELVRSLRPRPTALFCASDMIALGAMAAAVDMGLRVPGDLSVVGLDDIPFASLVRPRLTTVRQPSYDAGQIAVDLALDRLRHGGTGEKRIRWLPTRLVVRESTAAPPQTDRTADRLTKEVLR